jgi:hypothetical protein
MTTNVIRQKLHGFIETTNDKKVRALYTLIENDIMHSELKYTEEFKTELYRRTASYKNGSAKLVSAKESKKKIEALLKKRRVDRQLR